VELTEKDNGRTIEIAVGDLLIVRLNENPTTGYRWELVNTKGLEVAGDRFESKGDAIGAAGIRVFQFRANSLGRQELQLKNWRKWESDSSVIDHFDATIFVK
jgi:inhibitor of cysteine peptidase